jgi:hypothetical protein
MKWLRARADRSARGTINGSPDSSQQPDPLARPAPRLFLLVHDAAGPGAYQLHSFPDAKAAEEFVTFWFPPSQAHGLIAFWATHWRPQNAAPGQPRDTEAVVLVRDEDRRGIVYPFSLPEMALAQSWIAREAAMDLNLASVLVYWASPVAIARDRWDRVRLTPREAPERPKADAPPAEVASTPAQPAPAPVEEPPPPAPAATLAAADEAPAPPARADGSNLIDEVERLVRERRFEQREEPFHGFGSPEGKF